MKRRDFLKNAATLAVATTSIAAVAHDHSTHVNNHEVNDNKFAEVAKGAAECIVAGQECLSHCINLMANGDKEMGDCAKSVIQMLPLCEALVKLAAENSGYTAALAKVCAEACEACAKACEPHSSHHKECKACFDACKFCADECKKIAA